MTIHIGIDPGPHIGVAIHVDEYYATQTLILPSELYMMLALRKPDQVACESFYTGGRVDIHMIRTIEMVGGVKAVCDVLNIPLKMQQPQERKSFLQEAVEIIRTNNGFYSDAELRHERDALAQLLAMEARL